MVTGNQCLSPSLPPSHSLSPSLSLSSLSLSPSLPPSLPPSISLSLSLSIYLSSLSLSLLSLPPSLSLSLSVSLLQHCYLVCKLHVSLFFHLCRLQYLPQSISNLKLDALWVTGNQVCSLSSSSLTLHSSH